MSALADKPRQLATNIDSGSDLDLATRLRSDIVSGVYMPGDRLKFAVLSDRYASGHGSLREALAQLVTEGFATQEHNKGFAVAPVSKSELLEITEHYIDLEKRALADAIEHGDEEWETNIVAAHHRLQRIEKKSWEERVARHSDWVIRHREFHASLVSACQGTWHLKLRTLMFDQLDRYRYVTKMIPKGNGRSRLKEHQGIMESVLARDVSSTTSLLESHIRKTSERALKLL